VTHHAARVAHLQSLFDINHPMPITLHACAAGLQVPFAQKTALRLLRVAHALCCFYHQFHRDSPQLYFMRSCVSRVLWWGLHTAFYDSFHDVAQMRDVLPVMLRDLLRRDHASVQDTFMPIILRIERALRDDVLMIRIATRAAEKR
jgi:hypothetical protein